MFEVPVTLAVKSCMPEVGTEALVGLMLNKTATAAVMVTFAEADFVGSATLVAFTVTVAGEGTLDGEVYARLPKSYHKPRQCNRRRLKSRSWLYLKSRLHFLRTVEYFPATVALFGYTVIVTAGH